MPRLTKQKQQRLEAISKANNAKRRPELSPTEFQHGLKEEDTRERLLTEEEIAEETAAREWDEECENDDLLFDDEELPTLPVPNVLSAYEEMMNAATKDKWAEGEARLRTWVMKGDSIRAKKYQKAKQRDLSRAAGSMRPLTHWFSSASSSQPSLVPTEETTEEFEYEEFETELGWDDHIAALSQVLKATKNFSPQTQTRLEHLVSYMVLRRNGRSAVEASTLISEMVDRGLYYSKVIRAWAKQWMTQRLIPKFK
jgi:hypothetical protein